MTKYQLTLWEVKVLEAVQRAKGTAYQRAAKALEVAKADYHKAENEARAKRDEAQRMGE